VRETIELEKPKLVGLELCRERLEGLIKNQDRHMDLGMIVYSSNLRNFVCGPAVFWGNGGTLSPGGK